MVKDSFEHSSHPKRSIRKKLFQNIHATWELGILIDSAIALSFWRSPKE